MADKVARLGIVREPNFLYYVRNGDVWRMPHTQPGQPKGKPQKLAEGGFEPDPSYLYFLDREGDIARARRLGGKEPGRRKKGRAR